MIVYYEPNEENPLGYLYCEIDDQLNSKYSGPFTFQCVNYITKEIIWETTEMGLNCWSICSNPLDCESVIVDSKGRIADYWKWSEKSLGNKIDYIELNSTGFDSLTETLPDSLNGTSVDISRNNYDINHLIEMFLISEVEYLRINTELHDLLILDNLFNTKLRPKKIKFNINSLSEDDVSKTVEKLKNNNYIIVQKTMSNITTRLKTKEDYIDKLPILILLSGRRLNYLSRTIKSLFDNDIDFDKKFKSVWLLDDRSSDSDRFHMEKLMKSYFGENYTSVYFNDSEPYHFVEKFRFIKKIADPDDVVLLLEDDWLCYGDLSLNFHISNLLNSDWTQISFTDPIDIQDNETRKNNTVDFNYWRNPYPGQFTHPHKWEGDMCHWNIVSIDNWTNNPSIVKGSVFHQGHFNLTRNFEIEFSETINGKHVFTHECLFRHFGYDSLIDNLI